MIKQLMMASSLAALAACGNGGASVMEEIERAERERAAAAEQAAARSDEWLAEVRAQAGVEARPSGLLLEFRHRGANQNLPRPTQEAAVLVHYEGKLSDGTVFDSSFARGEPAEFPLAGVVPGFAEAIAQMRPGDEVIATFPAELGYGAQGQPPDIPGGAALQFRIALIAFRGPDGRQYSAPQ